MNDIMILLNMLERLVQYVSAEISNIKNDIERKKWNEDFVQHNLETINNKIDKLLGEIKNEHKSKPNK